MGTSSPQLEPRVQQPSIAVRSPAAALAIHRLTRSALSEIIAIMKLPSYNGNLWVSRWGSRFRRLGPLRHFLEQHPEAFVVESLPGCFRKYTVRLQPSFAGFLHS